MSPVLGCGWPETSWLAPFWLNAIFLIAHPPRPKLWGHKNADVGSTVWNNCVTRLRHPSANFVKRTLACLQLVLANGTISDPSRFMVFCETMLRLWSVMGWGGVGMLTFLEPAHILDATQLRYSCAHKHAWCHASCANKHGCVFLVKHAWCYGSHGVGWGGNVNVLRTCTHPGCYATVLF